jgi:hypothetical protein
LPAFALGIIESFGEASSAIVPEFLESVGGASQVRADSVCAKRFTSRGPVAQLAEQQTLNLLVEGSIPSGLTKLFQIN